MKAVFFILFAAVETACAQGYTIGSQDKTCASAVFNAKSGKAQDGKNYRGGKAPTKNDVLFVGALNNAKAISTINVPANKNNFAADIIIRDGLMIIEAGSEYTVPQFVKSCTKVSGCSNKPDRKDSYYDYVLNKPVTCGKTKCAKTCNSQTCDYWGKEEDYSCLSLEQEYGCDCFGCQCKVDHYPCDNKLARKKCNGKTCDEWTKLGISCAIMEKDFKCSCVGCTCAGPAGCDAKAIKKCNDAYKTSCNLGAKGTVGAKCGGCIPGYKSNGKGDCNKDVNVQPGAPKDKCGKEMKKKCGKKDFVGDGFCDDENNRAGCNWDNGDCCGPATKKTYCTKCQCLDCSYKPKGDACVKVIKGKCALKDYKKDGNCDDGNNNAGCNWDGGDCCPNKDNNFSVVKTYCTSPNAPKCKCLDCQAAAAPGDACVKSAKKSCALKDYKGDGNCDDGNNNAGCAWDGGDCCLVKLVKTYCTECKCKDCTKQKSCPKKGGHCGSGPYQGDGNCDDNNNNCACSWDLGDCCGTAVKKAYCTECKCKDPNYKAPKCGAPSFVGDGNCDDENNTGGCGWDKGDCCGAVKKAYCTVCKCLDPNYVQSCGLPAFKGDGNCDDVNNNAKCNYDGGDCCGSAVVKAYCTACKCLDPNYKPSACVKPTYKGDGFCDDENNVKSCNFDGGDCCTGDKSYCTLCQCKAADPASKCLGKCGQADFKGDGNCDDENNNCGCAYDGGDCCLPKVLTAYCKDCSCRDPKKPKTCNGKCGNKLLKGDGYCDDENNVCGCAYDGGDCCPTTKKVLTTYCTQCLCINPIL